MDIHNESTFVAPEGVYSVTEEHKPFLLVSHNTNSPPAIYPTRVSSVTVRYPPQSTKPGGTPGFAQLLNVGGSKGNDGKKEGSATNSKHRDDGISQSSSDTAEDDGVAERPVDVNSPISTDYPAWLSPPTSPVKKRVVRPKHNIRTTSSTFITRLQTGEGSNKSLQSKQGDVNFLFYTSGKTFLWVEVGTKQKEPLAKVTFSAHPTCHDVNRSTAAPDRLDVIIGFSTGDLVWLDPVSSRYGRLNKQGCITSSPCTSVRWVPSSSTLFLVSHADGTIIVYDKEREDGTFKPSEVAAKDWDPVANIFVTMPPWHPAAGGPLKDRDKAIRNPVSHWRVSRKSIIDFVFSPDVKYVGAISEDGCVRVIDALAEQLVDCYASYFGSFTCIAWSPDGRFILTGGQDDLLTLFSPWEQRVVARCQGHASFVTAVAFDDLRCDGRTYRFGSVGEDNKLILWDFSSGTLHRPKFHTTLSQRMSMSSTVSLAFRHDRSVLHLPVHAPATEENPYPRYHPAPSRNEVPIVQPVISKQIEGDLLAGLQFLQRHLVTATKTGLLKLWIRPLAPRGRIVKNGRRMYNND